MSKAVIFYDGGCANCQKVAGVLSAAGVDYLRYNVKGHPELMTEATRQGIKTFPTVVVGGKLIEGWDENRLKSELN